MYKKNNYFFLGFLLRRVRFLTTDKQQAKKEKKRMSDWKEKCKSCTAHLPISGGDNSSGENKGKATQCGLCSREIVKKCKHYNDRVCYAKCDTCQRFVCLDCKPIPVWVERSYHVCKQCFFSPPSASSSSSRDIFVHAPTIKAIFAEQQQQQQEQQSLKKAQPLVPVAELI
jgi:hypothetical protein